MKPVAIAVAITVVAVASPRAFADALYVVTGTVVAPKDGLTISISIDGGPEQTCDQWPPGFSRSDTLCAVASATLDAAAFTISSEAPGYERYRKNFVPSAPVQIDANHVKFVGGAGSIQLAVKDLPKIEKIVHARSRDAVRFSISIRSPGPDELLLDRISISATAPPRPGRRTGGPGGCLEQYAEIVYELADTVTLQANSSTGDTAALEAQVAVDDKKYTLNAEGSLTSNDCNGARSYALAFDASLKLPPARHVQIDLVMPRQLKFKRASRPDFRDRNRALTQTGAIDASFSTYTFKFHTTANHRFEAQASAN